MRFMDRIRRLIGTEETVKREPKTFKYPHAPTFKSYHGDKWIDLSSGVTYLSDGTEWRVID